MHCSRCNADHPDAEHCPACTGEGTPKNSAGEEKAKGSGDGDSGENASAVRTPDGEIPKPSSGTPPAGGGDHTVGPGGETGEKPGGSSPPGTGDETGPGSQGGTVPQGAKPTPGDTPAPGNGEGVRPPDETKEKGKKGRAGDTRVKKSKLRNFNSAPGSENTYFAEQVNNIFGGTDNGAPPPPKSLLEITFPLPAKEPGAPEIAAAEAAVRHRKVMSERLLLISCAHAGVSIAAAHAVVDSLGVAPGEARLLNFDRVLGEDAPQTIYALTPPQGERLAEIVVVVDAVSHRGQAFLDHLLDPRNGLYSASDLRGHLKDAGLLVICLAPRERFADASRAEPPFPHWAVSFLEPLLAASFPAEHGELCSAILRQQAAGRWSRSEEVFCGQVRTALSADTLKEVVAAGGPSLEARVTLDEEQPVHNAVLYTAGFFPRLNPADFGRVVTVLLGDETAPASSARSAPSSDPASGADAGAPAAGRSAARRDRKLAEVWRESGDRILRECRLTVIREPEGGRIVGFADPGMGGQLRERLEDELAFSLHNWFAALHRAGLLFDRSNPVAESLVRLTAGMAAEYPESYGRGWVMDRFAAARAAEGDTPGVFKRFAELLRGLCEHAVLRPLVAGVMEQLLAGREFRAALELVKRLRFAPGFDEFHWMRQLIDRGSGEIAESTSQFLFGQVLAAGPQVYPVLHALRAWVPAEDRPPSSYSPSNRAALQLLVMYAMETVDRVKLQDYGAWPSRYPLLAIPSAESAARDLPLVVGWLLHPGMPAAFAEEMEDLSAEALEMEEPEAQALRARVMERLVAAVLAEWVFILFGASGTPLDPSREPGPAAAGAEGFGPDALLDALAGELVARTADRRGREARNEMLAYWEEFKEELARVISTRGDGKPAVLAESVWKRRLLRVLPLRIRSYSRAAPAAAVPAAV
jgi:hypothetical protein